MKFFYPFIGFIFSLSSISGQSVNQSEVYRKMTSEKYIRLHYENDVFTASDQYYTQGLNLEFVHPKLKNNPVNLLLLCPDNFKLTYAVSFEHSVYTPSEIQTSEILYNDHPFSSTLLLKSIVIATGPKKDVRIVSSISTGVIGHLANGDCMQIFIHKWASDKQPFGWDNQIRNDIILNYQVNIERKLLNYKNSFRLESCGEIRIGTLHDRVGAGLVFMTGEWNDEQEYSGTHLQLPGMQNKIERMYFYLNTNIFLVGYNGLLQGGIFNEENPYKLKSDEIERLVLRNNAGVVLTYGRYFLEYFYSFQSREFKSGDMHSWGGFKLGVGF